MRKEKTRKLIIYLIILTISISLFFTSLLFKYKYFTRNGFIDIINNIRIVTFETKTNTEQKMKEKLENDRILCLQSPLDNNNLTEDIKSKINELNSVFSDNSLNISYYYEDLSSGYSLSYNSQAQSWAASVIKAPVVIYIYDLANKGIVDLDEKITYTPSYYAGGTGVIKNHKYYSTYSIRTLVEYAVKYSDNIAHRMLVKRFGMEDIKNYWRNLGSSTIFENGNLFSNFNAIDGYIVMKQLYNFANSCDLGKELMDYFKAAKPNFIIGNEENEIAHKYGWAQNILHDMAIVFDDKPYILVIFSNRGQKTYDAFFNDVSKKVNEIHRNYNIIKEDYCNNLEILGY